MKTYIPTLLTLILLFSCSNKTKTAITSQKQTNSETVTEDKSVHTTKTVIDTVVILPAKTITATVQLNTTTGDTVKQVVTTDSEGNTFTHLFYPLKNQLVTKVSLAKQSIPVKAQKTEEVKNAITTTTTTAESSKTTEKIKQKQAPDWISRLMRIVPILIAILFVFIIYKISKQLFNNA